MNESFKHQLGARVIITQSNREGHVHGRAEYANAENQYYVKYTNGHGDLDAAWFDESDLR